MKKLFLETLIMGMLVLVPSAAIATDKATVDTDEHLVMALIIDRTDVGKDTWNRSLILARQAMSLLKANDELILVTAGRDRNVIETTCRIDPDNAGQRTRLNQQLMALKYNWWCRAKIAEALQLAFSELNNRPSGHKCCIALSDGRYDNSETADIRHKAEVYKLSGISLLMTVTGSANKDLLLAGSRGEFDVAITEKSDLAGWFNRVRPQRDISAVAITPQPAAPLPVLPTTPSQPPVPQQPKKEDKSKVSETVSDKTEKPPIAVKEHKGFKQLLLRSAPLILLAIIAISIYCVIKFSRFSNNRKTEAIDSGTDTEPGIITAEYDGIKYELGDENAINNVVIGTSPASIIPLTDISIEEEHVKLFSKRGKLWIKNLSGQPVTINNLPLEKGKKELLLLPARIQLSDSVRIDLFKEVMATKNLKIEGD